MASKSIQGNQVMKSELSAKTLKNGCSREDIRAYFLQTYSVYEKLFTLIKDEKSYYTKPEPLRHPLIFYYGHTSCVYINKLFDSGLITQRINPKFQSIFAVGVDEMDWDDLNDAHYDWPSVREVTNYRTIVKNIVLNVIDKISPEISWTSDAWVIMMGIEHERIHLETSSVIMRRLPIQEINPHLEFIDCPKYITQIEGIPKNQLKQVPSYKFEWDRQLQNANVYGWDNEFGNKLIDVKSYRASKFLVSNGQFMEFVQDKGYQKMQFWDQEGRAWLKSVKANMPLFWAFNNGKYTLRTMNKIMPMPMDWPVQVNNLEATAFCNWKSQKLCKKLRLPTEDEYYAMRSILKKDHLDWQHGEVGNVNMEYWFSPNPIDLFKTGDFYDIVGNVWQHCYTPIYPFQNFDIHPVYEDFTTPTFDGRHFMIKGGSFVSTGNQTIKHSRFAFRRHFHQFAGFRYVQSSNPVFDNELLDESDTVVENFLKMHYIEKKSYVNKVIKVIKQKCENPNEKCLTVGCSVGRIVLQMSKHFAWSYGTDYSARFFQMATRLFEKSFLKYKDIEICIDDLQVNRNRVVLYQMNPQNPDPNKINGCSVVIFDGLAIKDKRIKKVIQCMKKVMNKKAKLIIINKQNRNNISLEQIREVMGDGKVKILESCKVSSSSQSDLDFQIKIQMFQVEQQ